MLIIIVSGGLTPLRYATHSARRRRKRRRRRRRRNRRRRRRRRRRGCRAEQQSENHRKTQKVSRKTDFWVSGVEGGGAESAAWEFLPLSERTSDAERKCCCWAKDKSFSLCILVHQVLRRRWRRWWRWGGVGGAVTGSDVEV